MSTSVSGSARITAAIRAANADGRAALIPYAVAGYPDADTSFEIALAQIDAGGDLLEVGLPYSDPLADGATLQRASAVALANGAALDDSIALVARIHAARPHTPLVAMGYVNQVLGGKDGETVLRRLGEAGVSGFILADLTPDEGAELEEEAAGFGIGIVYLVAPTTPVGRIP
ncbi:MAG TPA: tryptophan synthase subunit alpha, partial [Anaerolineae bacterium]|nr:tryptophan synthase subunit alpha [Anaerolineae bacterium]